MNREQTAPHPRPKDPAVAIRNWSIVLLAVGFLLKLTAIIVMPLVFAGFFAILFAPVANSLEARHSPRWLATGISSFGLVALLTGLGSLTVISVSSVANKSQDYAEDIRDLTHRAQQWLQQTLPGGDSMDIFEPLRNNADPLGLLNNVFSAGTVLAGVALVLVYFTFLLHYRAVIQSRFVSSLPKQFSSPHTSEKSSNRERILMDVQDTLRRYLWLKFLISVGTAAAIGVLSLVLGLDFVPAWVLLAFGLNFIPSLGPMLAVVPPVLVALIQGGFGFAALVLATMAAVHFLSGNVIEPSLIGPRLKMNFIAILLSLFIWNLIWGFAGMILAVPIMAGLKVLVDAYGYPWPLRLLLSPMRDPDLSEELSRDQAPEPSTPTVTSA